LLQPINNASTLSRPGFQDLDIWLSGPGSQNLNARFQDLDFRTWVSGPQREVSGPGSQDLGFRPSTRGFRTWISGPGFQALDARFQDLDLRTWVSGPRKLSILRSSYFFPVTFLCVHRHFAGRFCHRTVRSSDCPGRFHR